MFIESGSHYPTIVSEVQQAKKIWLAMAYVSTDGVKAFDGMLDGKEIKIICNVDLGITTLSAIKILLDKQVKVKIYKPASGIFHPKLWLFGIKNKPEKCIVGSANLTLRGQKVNVEAGVLVSDEGVVGDAHRFFQRLWNSEFAEDANSQKIEEMTNLANQQEKIRYKVTVNKRRQIDSPDSKLPTDSENVRTLLEFIDSWLEIPVHFVMNGNRMWRGWYIIPDQGMIDDTLIGELSSYLKHIEGEVDISEESQDKNWQALLSQYKSVGLADRRKDKMTPRGLFIRCRKNQLIKFGWVAHGVKENGKFDKQRIHLTPLGESVRDARDIGEIKELYTDYFMNFEFWGFRIVRFADRLLRRLSYITLDEFDYFVNHAINDEQLDFIVEMIEMYRKLTDDARQSFESSFLSRFEIHKGRTAKAVRSNYVKSLRHTLSAIGWCTPFIYEDEVLRLKQ